MALRPTPSPPETLIGRRLAGLGYALYAAPSYLETHADRALDAQAWLGPDESLRETVAARWTRATLPDRAPEIRADSLVSLRDLACAGLGLALLPCYLGDATPGLARLPGHARIDLGSALWLLTHEDLRRVARIDAVVGTLSAVLVAERVRLEGA